MGYFRAAHGWGPRKVSLPKMSQTLTSVMKLGTVIPYLKKIQNILYHYSRETAFADNSSADISIFFLEIGKFCYIKKYRYRLHFDT